MSRPSSSNSISIRSFVLVSALWALPTLALPTLVFAQVAGEPFSRSYNAGASSLGLGEGDILTLRSPAQGNHTWSVRAWWVHSDDPVVLDDASSNRLLSLVSSRSDVSLGIQRRVGEGWRLGFELPLTLSQTSPQNPVLNNGANTATLARPPSSGLGDVALSARRALGQPSQTLWELESRLTVPSSAADAFLGEDMPSLGLGLNALAPIGSAHFGGNAGFIFRERQSSLDTSLGSGWYARSGLSTQVAKLRYSGVVETEGTFGGAHLGTEIQGGVAYVGDRVDLGAIAALGVLGGVGGADWRVGLSLGHRMGRIEATAGAAGSPAPVERTPQPGAAAPPASQELAPKVSSGVEQDQVDAVRPIPEPQSDRDRDRDMVPDEDDLCPDTPEDRDGYEDENGCPDLDNDGDNVLDFQDQCPNVRGPPGSNGCPRGRKRQ